MTAGTVENRALFIIGGLALAAMLNVSYVVFVSQFYAYTGFDLDPSIIKMAEAHLWLLLLLAIVPAAVHRPSDFLISYFLLLAILPTLLLYGLGDRDRASLYIMLAGFSVMLLVAYGLPRVRIPFLKEGPMIGVVLSFAAIGGVMLWIFAQGAGRYFNLDLLQIYQYRSDVAELVNVGSLAYAVSMVVKAVPGVLLVWALLRRLWLVAIALVLCQIVFFSVLAHKSILFGIFLVMLVYLMFLTRRPMLALISFFIGLICLCFLAFLIFGDIVAMSVFIRRLFFVTAHLNFEYYSFFGERQFVFLSDSSFFGWLMPYPYDEPPPALIGEFMGTGGNANNGFLATGYMHFGIAGVVVYSAIAGLLLRLADWFTGPERPVWFGIGAVIMPFHTLMTGSDLTVTLLTHGLGLALVLLWMLGRGRWRTADTPVRRSRVGIADARLGPRVGLADGQGAQ